MLSIPVIWDTVREMLRREYYGGVIVDARQTPATISYSKALPAQTITFIGPDGIRPGIFPKQCCRTFP